MVRRVDRDRNPWLARVRVKGHREQSRTFASEAEARAWEAATILALRTGQPFPAAQAPTAAVPVGGHCLTIEQASRETIRAMLAGAARTRTGGTYRPTSITTHEALLRLHVLPRIGRVAVADLTRADLVRLREELMIAHSDALAGRAIDALRVVLRRQRDRGVVDVNVADGLPPMVVARREARFLSLDEGARLQAAADDRDSHLGMLVRLLLATGMRRGEAEGLFWGSVAPGSVHVRCTLRRDGTLGPTKSGKDRTVPVGPDTSRALAAWRLRCGRPADNVPVVGPHDRIAWQHARAAVGGSLTLHDLRHTAATWWLSGGLNVHVVAELLGHSDATLVLRLYGHALPQDASRAGDVMDALRREAAEAATG